MDGRGERRELCSGDGGMERGKGRSRERVGFLLDEDVDEGSWGEMLSEWEF